jgi:hypothetical protein
MGRYIQAHCIDRVAKSVLRVAPVSVFQYGNYIKTHFSGSPVMDSFCLVQYPKCVPIWYKIELGLKVFMDAYMPVTHEERDRYPLGPPQTFRRQRIL